MFWESENLLTGQPTDSDTEVLQTDIQRFLAILGFCLMAVFSLVQAIPVQNGEGDPQLKHIQSQLSGLTERVSQLDEENKALRERLAQASKTREGQEAATSERIKELEGELAKASKEIDDQKQQIAALRAQVKNKEQQVVEQQQRINDIEKHVKKIEEKKREVQEKFKDLFEQFENLKSKKKPKNKKASSTGQAGKGLVVRFESKGAFMRMLEQGAIQALIQIKGVKLYFGVTVENGEVKFGQYNIPSGYSLWEISEDQVPDDIVDGFKRHTTIASKDKMFIVGLPDAIHKNINMTKTSGEYVIHGNGKVEFNE